MNFAQTSIAEPPSVGCAATSPKSRYALGREL
jgi:hypothetical protein